MNHIVYSPKDKIVVVYNDDDKTIIDAEDEFIHAMVERLKDDLVSKGKFLDKVRSLYHDVMYKLGVKVPEFFAQSVVDDKRTGTRYIIKMEIIPGGCAND